MTAGHLTWEIGAERNNDMTQNEKISVLVPTRGRTNTTHGNFPDLLIKSAEETADDFNSIEFVFYIDDDDTDSQEYFKNLHYDNC